MSDGEAGEDFSALREDIDALRIDVGKLSGDLRKLAKDRVDSEKSNTRDAANRVRNQSAVVAEELGRRIEEQPVLSVAVAFGIGLLIGRLINRR